MYLPKGWEKCLTFTSGLYHNPEQPGGGCLLYPCRGTGQGWELREGYPGLPGGLEGLYQERVPWNIPKNKRKFKKIISYNIKNWEDLL